MGFCYEFDTGCCSCLVRTTVCTALCHFMIHGIFITSFAFTNISYPPMYYVDYVFGGCGAGLFLISFLTACVVDLKKLQFLRIIFALLTSLIVIATIVASFYYVIMRWNDVMITAFTYSIRKPAFKSLPDGFWSFLAVVSCLVAPIFLIYLLYILSFLCNKWKSHLFTMPYMNNREITFFAPPLSVPADIYSKRSYKPYPTQKLNET